MDDGVTLRDVMRRDFVGVTESDTLRGTVELLAAEDADCAVVLRGGSPVGLLTPREVYGAVDDDVDFDSATVSDHMTDLPVALDPADRLADAIAVLGEGDGGRVLVTNGGEVQGLVAASDLVTAGTVHGPGGRGPEDTGLSTDLAASGSPGAGQGVCEVCGSLSSDLAPANGQLACPNCRNVSPGPDGG